MKDQRILAFEKRHAKGLKTHPSFRPGDTVKVYYKILEGTEKEKKDKKDKGEEKKKYRIQPYEGVVVRYRKGTADASFTVRKISAGGVGVERTFPLCSPFIERIEVLASGVVRRGRLYFLRDRTGKSAKIRSRYHGRRESLMAALAMPEPTSDEAAAQAAEQPATPTEQAPEQK